jgi:glycine oxidase
VVKAWDAIIIGGGVIGLSLARELRKHRNDVLIVERGEPGREASHAAAGMLAYGDPEPSAPLLKLRLASAALYREFVHEVEDEAQVRVDFRQEGTIAFFEQHEQPACSRWREIGGAELGELEPNLAYSAEADGLRTLWLEDGSVDNRALSTALAKAARHRGIDVASGTQVREIMVEKNHACGVRTERTEFRAAVVVNCAGAWAGDIAPERLPTRAVKGQMLSVVSSDHAVLRHAVRAPGAYLVPRSDGRILIGATVEEAGYDKRVDPEVIQRLHQAAANLVPQIGELRIHEAWAGLRPASPDNMPMLGATSLPGYFAATAHFRNGILLAPITAKLMAQVILGQQPDCDLSAFSPRRFAA